VRAIAQGMTGVQAEMVAMAERRQVGNSIHATKLPELPPSGCQRHVGMSHAVSETWPASRRQTCREAAVCYDASSSHLIRENGNWDG
jgi:hypothetical protein